LTFQWDLENKTCLHTYDQVHELNVSSVACRSDSSFVVTGSRDYHVKCWDTELRRMTREFSAPRNIVTALTLDSPGVLVYQGSEDLCVRVWDSRVAAVVPSMHITGFVYFPLCVALHDNGYLLATGCKGFDGNGCEMKLWDVRRVGGGPILSSRGVHRHDVTACAFTRDHNYLLSASKDGSVCAWNTTLSADAAPDATGSIAACQTDSGKHFTSLVTCSAAFSLSPNTIDSAFVGAFDGSVSKISLVRNSNKLDILTDATTAAYLNSETEG
jgi:WD40 repeat protein